jgi:hypothetical protein
MKRLLALVLVIGLAGCADQTGDASASTPPADPGASGISQPSDGPSLVPGMTLTGVLGADSIEGGCMFLEADDGLRYEVIWPDGWEVTPELDLIDADGEVVAEGGDRISIRGDIATGMASICQVGQIFEATDVTLAE